MADDGKRPVSLKRIPLLIGVLGAAVALYLLLPLPPAGDLYAARRYGVGASYVGFILGFPLGVVAIPLSVVVHPFPAGANASCAGVVAATMATIVGANWALWSAGVVALVRVISKSSTHFTDSKSQAPV